MDPQRSFVTKVSYLYWQPVTPRFLPVLLVHGVCGNAEQMHFLARKLCDQGCPVFAIDLPGHGQSKVFWKWLLVISDHVQAVCEMCLHIKDKMGVHPILIGHSMGAWIIDSYIVLCKPVEVPAVVSLSAPPLDGLWGPTVAYWKTCFGRFVYSAVTQNIKKLFSSKKLFLRYLSATSIGTTEGVEDLYSELEYETYLVFLCMLLARSEWELETLSLYSGKRLHVVGENDNLFSPLVAYQDAQQLDLSLRIIPCIGHGLIYPQAVDKVSQKIIDFFESQLARERNPYNF